MIAEGVRHDWGDKMTCKDNEATSRKVALMKPRTASALCCATRRDQTLFFACNVADNRLSLEMKSSPVLRKRNAE